VPPKAAQLVLPGAGYTAADLERFSAAGKQLDLGLLEIAWSIAVDDPSAALTLGDLSRLLFDDEAPLSLYTTYLMLQADSLFFQQAGKVGGRSLLGCCRPAGKDSRPCCCCRRGCAG
jgi:hypothetical protein